MKAAMSRGAQACADDHISEAARFEELGRLLKEVKAFARRAIPRSPAPLLCPQPPCTIMGEHGP